MRALVTALVALALLALPAGALASEEVRVEPEGASARTLTLSGLGEPDVLERTYTVNGAPLVVTGWSLDLVLRKGRVDPYRFGSLSVALTDGTIALGRDDVVSAGAFPDGPPVFWVEEGQARFLRPGREDGEPAQLVGGGPVTVGLSRDSELAVSVTASTRRTKPGRPVTFRATVSGAPDGEPVEISWYFDDHESASGARVTHRFERPGTYDVVVGATTSSTAPGADATVTVTVGKPPKGPDRKGGGTSDDPDAPDSGAATGESGDSSGTAGAEEPSGPAEPEAEAAPTPKPEPERKPRKRKREEPAAQPTGREIEGIELADLSALSSDAGRDALQAARRGQLQDDEREPGEGIPPALWWSLGAVGLLGLGAWLERRGAPPRHAA